MSAPQLPRIAIVGRPNVGKSTLYNRLTGRRTALVPDMPGLTRDRREGEAEADGHRVTIIDTAGLDLAGVKSGDSIAVDGVCLTAVELHPAGFAADVSQETLNCTTGFAAGSKVNLEKSLRLADPAFRCPPSIATAKSAKNVSSVSPERCERK